MINSEEYTMKSSCYKYIKFIKNISNDFRNLFHINNNYYYSYLKIINIDNNIASIILYIILCIT